MRYCPGDRKPHSSIVTLRATWTIHASLGCGVTPALWTFRLARWRKKSTEYVTSPAVVQTSAVKKSRSEEHTSELQSLAYLVCRLLLEKKKKINTYKEMSDTRTTS